MTSYTVVKRSKGNLTKGETNNRPSKNLCSSSKKLKKKQDGSRKVISEFRQMFQIDCYFIRTSSGNALTPLAPDVELTEKELEITEEDYFVNPIPLSHDSNDVFYEDSASAIP